MADSTDLAIAALAGSQQGNVARWQLLGQGLLGRNAIAHRVASGRLHRVFHGVYAVGRPPTTPLEWAAAAVLACGPDALLSHRSAATLWGFAKGWRTPFEVTVPTSHRHRGIAVHRCTTLTREDATRQLGIPVTSPARTMLDYAPSLQDRQLTRVFNDGVRSCFLRRDAVRELLARAPRHPSTKRLWPLLEHPDNPTRSELEDAFMAFCERFGFPRPQLNVRSGGNEVDAIFKEERLIVELDGYEFHSDRDAFERDRERDASALEQDIATLRVTWDRMMHRPESEAARLQKILARRRP